MRAVGLPSKSVYSACKQQTEENEMNQTLTGKFIAHKRKEKNLTQEQLTHWKEKYARAKEILLG